MFTCKDHIRETLSEEEQEALTAVTKAAKLAGTRAAFTLGGELTKSGEDGESIYYYKGPEDEAIRLRLPATANDIAKLSDIAVPSPHGAGQETVLDPGYRTARELKAKQYALDFDPLLEILPQIQQLNPNEQVLIEARREKLNIYAEGGFFKSHRDTSKSENHIGSLVVCLPSDFTGGQLVVRQDGRVETYDWSECCAAGRIGWCFLYSDCDHEVLPVTAGARLTLAYSVYSNAAPAFADSSDDLVKTEVYQKLANLCRVPSKQDKTIAFGMNHDYPTAFGGPISAAALKGADRLVYLVARLLGLKAELMVVFEKNAFDWFHSREPRADRHETGWPLSSRCDGGLYYCEDGEEDDFEPNADLIWISETGVEFQGGTYATYGNDVSLEHVFVSGVILIHIPAGDKTEQISPKRKEIE